MRDEADAMQHMAEGDLAVMRADTRGKSAKSAKSAKSGEAYANLVHARSLSQLYRSTVLPQGEGTVASADSRSS